jgi:hypothetical protein
VLLKDFLLLKLTLITSFNVLNFLRGRDLITLITFDALAAIILFRLGTIFSTIVVFGWCGWCGLTYGGLVLNQEIDGLLFFMQTCLMS